jgi:hypothetical protein
MAIGAKAHPVRGFQLKPEHDDTPDAATPPRENRLRPVACLEPRRLGRCQLQLSRGKGFVEMRA